MTPASALTGPAHALNRELARVDRALNEPPTAERFEELSLAVSNLSYLLAYLDGNSSFIDTAPLTDKIRGVLGGDAFQLRCADWLMASKSSIVEPSVASCWLEWIEERQDPSAKSAHVAVNAALSQLDDAVRKGDEKLLELLHGLGAKTGKYNGNAAFMALTSRVKDPCIRMRLSRAKELVDTETATTLRKQIDALVAKRFAAGLTLERTMSRCSLTVTSLENFLGSVFPIASAASQTLIDQLELNSSDEVALSSEFPHFLARNFGAAAHIKLPLEPVLDMLGEITKRALNIQIQRGQGFASPLSIRHAGRFLGLIELDVIGTQLAVEHNDNYCMPTARILCRLNGSEPPTLSFDAMRMVFHEFGHALAHIMSRDRRPSLSGLDSAPVERLELLSTWFEHWIYHRDVAKRLSLEPEDTRRLHAACVAKLLESRRNMIGRAVCAQLDLDLHKKGGVLAHTAWDKIVAQLPRPTPASGDVLADFAHPMMRHHPGSAFVFPLGQVFAADKLLALIDRPITTLSSSDVGLDAAVLQEVSLEAPDAAATERFFDKVQERMRIKGTGT